MKSHLLIAACLVLMTGCTAHYYDFQGEVLTLYLDKPDAKKVFLASSLDGFQPHEVRKVDGHWVISMTADTPFRYFYLLDGQSYLPPCRMTESDDFGSENCIFDPKL